MLIKKLFKVVTVIGYLFLITATDVYTMDEGGCLTCHQYPGLVRAEKPNRLLILHIDEKKRLGSSHGRFDCRECHSKITSVPHTGKTEVSCAARCHHDEKTMKNYDVESDCTECHPDHKKEVRLMDHYLSAFHEKERSALLNLNSESSCRVCHPLYSHSENNMVRAYINLHAGFIICEVCHLRNNHNSRLKVCGECHSQNNGLIYEWGAAEGVDYTGNPFGLYSKNNKSGFRIMQNIKNSISGLLSGISGNFFTHEEQSRKKPETGYSISRIGVFTVERGKQRSLMTTWDTDKAIEFKALEKRMPASERKRRLKYFHRDIARLEISVVCEECHSQHSMLDYKKLGFDPLKANRVKNLDIKGLATKYKTFYFPKFLGAK